MELVIRGRNLVVTEDVERYVQKKLGKLQRHLGNISETKVELSRELTRSRQHRMVVQVTLNANGTLLRAQERGPDLFMAIDSVADVMDRQVQRYKGRLYKGEQAKKSGRGASIRYPVQSGAEERVERSDTLDSGQVVRTKRFPMKPMTVEEAVTQMELLGHDFFLFYNSASGEFNVLYRRQDGHYGIIEPELL